MITYRVHLLRFVGNLGGLLALDVALLELRQETAPIFLGQRRILGELTLDHEFLFSQSQRRS